MREGGEELGEYIKMLNGKRVIDIEMVENFLNNSGFHKRSKRKRTKFYSKLLLKLEGLNARHTL